MKKAQLYLSHIVKGLAFMLILAPLTVSAQSRAQMTPVQRADMMTQRMHEKLHLSDQQTKEVKNITEKYAHQVENLNKTSSDEATKVRTRHEIVANMSADLKKVFTKNQYSEYEVMLAQSQQGEATAPQHAK